MGGLPCIGVWNDNREVSASFAIQIPKDPSVEPYVSGGTFDQRVWSLVARIPYGRLATYGQIAELMGAFGCARHVGWALRRLKLPSTVPWHRVVNAQGRISMSLSREGSDWMQRELLMAEGIPVDGEAVSYTHLRAHET